MFKKILVPLDGSKNAERALPWAERYAGASGGQIVLVRVLTKVFPLEGMPFEEGEEEARKYLEEIAARLGASTKIALPAEPVAPSIVNAAIEERCGLVAMSTRGGSKVVRWLIGGITEQVMRLSPLPVLIVSRSSQSDSLPDPRRILVPFDGSTLARRILPWARHLSRLHGATLVLLHVRPRGSADPSDRLAALAERIGTNRTAATFLVVQGDPASEILKACRASDVIAMSTHGYGGIKRWAFGSVAEKVIHGARVPVFVFKSRKA